MSNLIMNENGTPFLGKPGQFTQFNSKPGETQRIPGACYYIKGKRLFRDPSQVNPYASAEIELIEQQNNIAFVKIGGNTWYWFPIRVDEENREYFISERNHVIGVNDVESRAYAEFITQVHTIKEAAKLAAQRAESQRQEAKLKAEQESRKADAKTLQLEVQKKIQVLTPGKSIPEIIKDKKIRELMGDYQFLVTLQTIRAL
jgi:hypothetical protein